MDIKRSGRSVRAPRRMPADVVHRHGLAGPDRGCAGWTRIRGAWVRVSSPRPAPPGTPIRWTETAGTSWPGSRPAMLIWEIDGEWKHDDASPPKRDPLRPGRHVAGPGRIEHRAGAIRPQGPFHAGADGRWLEQLHDRAAQAAGEHAE